MPEGGLKKTIEYYDVMVSDLVDCEVFTCLRCEFQFKVEDK